MTLRGRLFSFWMKKRPKSIEKEPTGTDISQLETRLNLLK